MADITPTATPPLSRGSSFQRMLELEKRYRLERLQSDQEQSDLLPSSPTEPLSPRAPLQLRRANSLSQQQQDLMLKAVRRSIAPPPLSIAIPPPSSGRRINEATPRDIGQEREPEPDLENVESLQKSVKFLAPDSDEDEESDQSSICHSPSWEGYGQKKRDNKKKEAERKRKAKEQKDLAEREAKAAKKRASSRLNKAAPLLVRQMPTVMERSNSAPLLNSYNFRATNRGHQMPTVDDKQECTETESYQNSLLRSITPDSTELLDSTSNRFIGGLKLQQEKEAALQHAISTQFPHVNGPDPRQKMHKSYTTGPASDMSPLVSGGSSLRNDSRSSRESCPPSASRTPMLRHNSAQLPTAKAPRGRDSKNHPVTSSYSSNDHSQEPLQPDGSAHSRGRKDGYVRQQRDQSTERALAVLLDEQLVSANASSSTRSSSQHTRRSSLSRDVKAAAFRLTGHKGASAKTVDHVEHGSVDQGDYFNYLDQPGSPLVAQALSPSGGIPSSTRSKATQAQSTSSQATQESVGSDTSVHPGATKTRSLKDVARAALHMSPSQTQVPTFKPTVKPPPYYILRAKFSSSSSVPTLSAPTTSGAQAAQPSKSSQNHSTSGPSAAPNQPGSRVSEGSSSSSNYDDGSPLPSPVTTPDTSRPQSSKGLPPVEGGTLPNGQANEAVVQDDPRTLRQLSETTSSESSSNVTPRLTQYDDEGNEMPPEDRWSRTAMPMDIDFDDAQSTVSDYSDAREEPVKTTSAPAKLESGTGAQGGRRFNEPGDSFSRPHLSRSHSDPDLTGISMATNLAQEPAIPRRSKARQQHEQDRPKTASAGQQLGKQSDKENEKAKEEPRESEQRKKKLRKQKPVPETKPDRMADEDAEVIERTSDDLKLRATQASANTSLMSARFMSPIGGFIPSYGFASNPLFVDFSEISKAASTSDQGALPVKITATQITFQPQAPASKPVTEAVQTTTKIAAPEGNQHQLPAPEPAKAAMRTLSTPTPAAGPKPTLPPRSTTTPVSILKPTAPQPQGQALPQVLSAIPKHLQPQNSARSQALAPPELRMAPIAKMFVECCSCKFYHDMPSKLYECMAKPDAVVEDKLRGISGAITTMVKCPWCQHNMSTSCCAGYAAVVYVKEKLH
ncbi:hypothetical protein CONLIGDRAFT_521874 [Coniochaeta ligniaria NRRL 30616]|uniref:Uncharacterized protein n=1 Tax=Coniochaeta ligniaria NRRL 30616 TaxID=1408157 RepID=A0A1J7IFV9_9PEZI|nr:hypothetical protein CONLIGDRAFT_521874 [Coniochaeta ligniaria NRRL 30616]